MSKKSFDEVKKEVRELISMKDKLGKELVEIKKKLDFAKVGVKGPLVDKDGYPIPKINLYEVKLQRQSYWRKQTDFSNIMKKIEVMIPQLHKMKKVDVKPKKKVDPLTMIKKLNPFLIVDIVFDSSPAKKSGLLVGDLILKFASIDKIDFAKGGFKQLSGYVTRNENKEFQIFVVRGKEKKSYHGLKFTPRKWKGKGLLGCHVKPL